MSKRDVFIEEVEEFIGRCSEEAKEYFQDVCENVDILFLNEKNETQQLFEIETIDNLIKYFWGLGIGTIIIKSPDKKGYYVGFGGDIQFINFYTENCVDSTCSEDAFAGGFLHGIATGLNPFEATKLSAIVEGLQMQKIGAIKSLPSKTEVYEIYKGA